MRSIKEIKEEQEYIDKKTEKQSMVLLWTVISVIPIGLLILALIAEITK